MSYFLYGGLYRPRPGNEPVEAPPVNPLPENKMTLETGNAGLDGYSVLSRANRYTGERPISHATSCPEGPNLLED